MFLKEDGSPYLTAKAIKALLTVDNLSLSDVERSRLAAAILERFGVADVLEAKELAIHSKNYWIFLEETFHPQKIYKKYPIRHHYQNRLFEKIIDLILITEQGLVIIQNSSFARGKKEWKNKALKLSPWFFLAKEAAVIHFGKAHIRCLLHYPLAGGLVELKVEKQMSTLPFPSS